MLEDEIYNENLVDDPDDLERIIEGEDNEDNRANLSGISEAEEDNTGNNKENNEQTGQKVEPKRKRSTNPQPKLNEERLKGPRGMGIVETFFKDVKLKGKGHEKEDLDIIMRRLEHWAHRLFPRYKFDDCLEKIEKLGARRPIQNYLKRIRMGMEDDSAPMSPVQPEEPPPSPPMVDPFDELIGNRPSQTVLQPAMTLSSEQRERMLRNRLIAEERKLARMKAQQEKQRVQVESSLENDNVLTDLPPTTSDRCSTIEEEVSRVTNFNTNLEFRMEEENSTVTSNVIKTSFDERTESCGVGSKTDFPSEEIITKKRRIEEKEVINKMARLDKDNQFLDVRREESIGNMDKVEMLECPESMDGDNKTERNEESINKKMYQENEHHHKELDNSDGFISSDIEKENCISFDDKASEHGTNEEQQNIENHSTVTQHLTSNDIEIRDCSEAISEDGSSPEIIHKGVEPCVLFVNSDSKEKDEFNTINETSGPGIIENQVTDVQRIRQQILDGDSGISRNEEESIKGENIAGIKTNPSSDMEVD